MKTQSAPKIIALCVLLQFGVQTAYAQTAASADYSKMGLIELSTRARKGDQKAAEALRNREKILADRIKIRKNPQGVGSSAPVLGASKGLGLTPKKWKKDALGQEAAASDNVGQTKAPALLKPAQSNKIKYSDLDKTELISLARSGNPDAQYELAGRLEYGNPGIVKDVKNAFLWEMEAAKKGHALAQYDVSLKYTFGKGVEVSNENALYWMRKSAGNGYFAAQYSLFETYLAGVEVDKNPVEAALWATRAYAQKDKLSEEMRKELRRVYKFDQPKSQPSGTLGQGKLKNLGVAVKKPGAGQSLATRKLAEISKEFVILGKKIKARIAKVKAGDISAEGRKESMRLRVQVKQLNEAAKFWRAMQTLGKIKKHANITKQNIRNSSKAIYSLKFVWKMKPVELKALANRGDRDAQRELASRYENGNNGFEKKPVVAFQWMLKAANKGDPRAQYNTAANYFDGKGVAKSNMLAAQWLLKSGESGNKFAQLQLHKEFEGRTYFVWGIFEKNLVKAEYWLNKAVAQGFKAAIAHRRSDHVEF